MKHFGKLAVTLKIFLRLIRTSNLQKDDIYVHPFTKNCKKLKNSLTKLLLNVINMTWCTFDCTCKLVKLLSPLEKTTLMPKIDWKRKYFKRR